MAQKYHATIVVQRPAKGLPKACQSPAKALPKACQSRSKVARLPYDTNTGRIGTPWRTGASMSVCAARPAARSVNARIPGRGVGTLNKTGWRLSAMYKQRSTFGDWLATNWRDDFRTPYIQPPMEHTYLQTRRQQQEQEKYFVESHILLIHKKPSNQLDLMS